MSKNPQFPFVVQIIIKSTTFLVIYSGSVKGGGDNEWEKLRSR